MNPILDAALDYAGRGWSVLQTAPDKKPLGKWKEAQLQAATPDEIAAAWKARPQAWVGVVTGEVSGILVVDIDAKQHEAFLEAKRTLEGLVPDSLCTPMARTKSGGEHWYFRRPAGGMGNRAHVRGLSVDIRCDGGYVVAPSSPGYSWIVSPNAAALAELPAALAAWLKPPTLPDIDATPDLQPTTSSAEQIARRAEKYAQAYPPAISGQNGHGVTYRLACELVNGFALDGDAWGILVDYNRRCEPPWSEKELRHKLDQALACTKHEKARGHLLGEARPSRSSDRSRLVQTSAHEPDEPGDHGGGGLGDARKLIRVTADESRVVGEAGEALTHHLAIYQRGGMLVRVVDDAPPAAKERTWLSRDLCAPRIEPLPKAWIEVRLTEVANFVRLDGKAKDEDGKPKLVPIIPPNWVVESLASSSELQGIRHLVSIIETPQMRPDGTLVERPGYDRATGLVYRPLDRIPPIKERPSIDDAVAARDELLEVAADFPFESAAHRGAWLSMILTGMARAAIDGATPLFLIDANVRGAGKTLLAQATSIITTGRQSPVMLWPEDEEERRKAITALAIAGDNIVLLDNVEGVLGGAALNAALTSTTWTDRILGLSKTTGRLPLTTCWVATANNCELGRDTTRRTIHVRITSPLEHPEDRIGFKHPNLKRWVQEHRPRLVATALTILRAYEVAGRPDMKLPPMADYIGWQRIRSVVAWLGLPDPLDTQRVLTSQSDRDAGELRSLVRGIQSVTSEREWLSASELLERASQVGGETFKAALVEYCSDKGGNLPTARSFGWRLRRYSGRVVDSSAIEGRDNAGTGMKEWRVTGGKSYGRRGGPAQGELL
jgi:hypothetical protein